MNWKDGIWRNKRNGVAFARIWWTSLLLSFQTRMILSRCAMWGRSCSMIFLASLWKADIVPRSSLCLKKNHHFECYWDRRQSKKIRKIGQIQYLPSSYRVWNIFVCRLRGSLSGKISSSSFLDRLAPWSIMLPPISSPFSIACSMEDSLNLSI